MPKLLQLPNEANLIVLLVISKIFREKGLKLIVEKPKNVEEFKRQKRAFATNIGNNNITQ